MKGSDHLFEQAIKRGTLARIYIWMKIHAQIVIKCYISIVNGVKISTVLMMPSVRRLAINIVSILLVVFVSKREFVSIILSVKESIFSV